MKFRLLHIDAFTRTPFTGNPAAVCLFAPNATEAWMQSVAAEMNLAETAFLARRNVPGNFDLRWFTPTAEVPLCGHATLASAHALWQEGETAETLTFHTKSGELRASRSGAGITLDFPAIKSSPCDAPEEFAAALGASIVNLEQTPQKYIAELESEESVRALQPDIAAIAKLPRSGVVVTARSSKPDYDFVSRFFAPAIGVPEDPVTGSAHCVLGPYWAARLGKREFRARQLSRRGGEMSVRLADGRAFLTGHALTVFAADMEV